MKLNINVLLLSLVLILVSCDQDTDREKLNQLSKITTEKVSMNQLDLSLEDVRTSYLKHAILTQLHRWFLVYENSQISIKNQLDILSTDIHIKSSLGEGNGHEEYRQRVEQLPKTWKNAHFLKNHDIKINGDGSSDLKFEISYLNSGMNSDGKIKQVDISYITTLKLIDEVLPKFTDIEISPINESEAPEFKSAYAENRLLSLIHYWLTLIENPERNLTPFKEILADNFKLNFSSGEITDFSGFEKWFRGPASSVSASTHILSNFSYKETKTNEYQIGVDFDWQGILPNNQQMVGKTRHKWTVIDDPTDRFAKIKVIEVEVLLPFQAKSS